MGAPGWFCDGGEIELADGDDDEIGEEPPYSDCLLDNLGREAVAAIANLGHSMAPEVTEQQARRRRDNAFSPLVACLETRQCPPAGG